MSPPSADVMQSRDSSLPSAMLKADGQQKKGRAKRPTMSDFATGKKVDLPSSEQAGSIASKWLSDLQAALDKDSMDDVMDLFQEDAYFKDLLTFEWDHHNKHGKQQIRPWLEQGNKLFARKVQNIKYEKDSAAGLEALPGVVWIMAFFGFETTIARGRGAVRLSQVPGSQQWKAYLFYTGIEELKGYEEQIGSRRPQGVVHGNTANRTSWLARREKHIKYEDGHEPEVLVVGAGHAGLMAAARLSQLGVDTLIVDKNDRIGDNWRKRYEFLVLHDPVWYNTFPNLPYPAHWPVFTPKDKLGDWMEFYAAQLELNVWMKTYIGKTSYDEAKGQWSVEVINQDGTSRTLHPKHVVMATGHSGEPNMPNFKGMDVFKGKICHSSQHTTGRVAAGKHAVVIGCCNSGHDIAQDFVEQGAKTTMVQRSSTYIMSSKSVTDILFRDIYNENGPPVEDCDLIFNSQPNPIHFQQMAVVSAEVADFDKEILDGLEDAGFSLAWGPQNAGFLPLYFTRGGGYYLDIAASSLIANGDIKIKQGQEIDHLEERHIVFADGSKIEADIIVCATGYQNMKTTAVRLFGDEAKKTNEVWGLDDEGELKTIWRPSGHPAFSYMGGNFALCRFMSKRLALRILSQLRGIK